MSLPEQLIADANDAVENGHADSVSAYVARAMEGYGKHETLQQLLREWDAELGPPSTDDYLWADEQLDRLAGRSPRGSVE